MVEAVDFIHAYRYLTLVVGALFFYQLAYNLAQLKVRPTREVKLQLLLCGLCGFWCINSFFLPSLPDESSHSSLKHLGLFLGTSSTLVYIHVMNNFLKLRVKLLKTLTYFTSILCIFFLISTLIHVWTNYSLIFDPVPNDTNILFRAGNEVLQIPKPYVSVVLGLLALATIYYYYEFFKAALSPQKKDYVILIGIFLNFALLANDFATLADAHIYAVPLGFLSFLIESLKLTFLEMQAGSIKINELEGEVLEVSKIAEMGTLVGYITHDIRNPLSTLKFNSDRLDKVITSLPDFPERDRKRLDTIIKATNRIDKIIKEYLKLYRDEANLVFHPVNIANAVAEAKELCSYKIHSIQIDQIHSSIDPNLYVNAHENQLVMSFVNILSNSCDAIESISERWIEIKGYLSDNQVVLEFVDSGSGISQDLADKLFSRRSTTEGKAEGVGLGLNFVKKIVSLHDGEAYFDTSRPNTTLIMKFPPANVVKKAS